jgi:hypothetical protein
MANWDTFKEFIKKDPIPSVQPERKNVGLVSRTDYENHVRTHKREFTDSRYTGNRSEPQYNSSFLRTDHISFKPSNVNSGTATLSSGKTRFSANAQTSAWEPKSSAMHEKPLSIYDPIRDCAKVVSVSKDGRVTAEEKSVPVSFSAQQSANALRERTSFNRTKGISEFFDQSSAYAPRTNPLHRDSLADDPRSFHRKRSNLGT